MKKLLFLFAIVGLIVACDSSKNQKASKKLKTISRLPDTGTSQLLHVVDAYILLKDALSAADTANLTQYCSALKAKTTTLQHISSHSMYEGMFANLESLYTMIQLYSDSLLQGPDWKSKIYYFKRVDDGLNRLIRTVELRNEGLYRLFCKKANDDAGGYWFSRHIDSANPYLGNKVLYCTEIRDSF